MLVDLFSLALMICMYIHIYICVLAGENQLHISIVMLLLLLFFLYYHYVKHCVVMNRISYASFFNISSIIIILECE